MKMRLTLVLLLAVSVVYGAPTTNKYGVFNLTITKFELCKGPKQKSCATSKATINTYYSLKYEIDVLQNYTPTKGKIVASTNGKEFLRLQVKKPCEHLFLRPLFGALMNVTEDCIILKGHYSNNVNIQDIAKQYFGGTFLFGNWTFKSLFYSDLCNFSCSVIQVTLIPLGE